MKAVLVLANYQEISSCLPNCQNPVHLMKSLLPQVISLKSSHVVLEHRAGTLFLTSIIYFKKFLMINKLVQIAPYYDCTNA
jgi:hypothetical protein